MIERIAEFGIPIDKAIRFADTSSSRTTRCAHSEASVQIKPLSSYRCSYHPKDGFGAPLVSETGLLPFVQLKAPNADLAQRMAHAVTGCAVSEATRVEPQTEVFA